MSDGWRIIVVCNVTFSVVLGIYLQLALNAIGRLERGEK